MDAVAQDPLRYSLQAQPYQRLLEQVNFASHVFMNWVELRTKNFWNKSPCHGPHLCRPRRVHFLMRYSQMKYSILSLGLTLNSQIQGLIPYMMIHSIQVLGLVLLNLVLNTQFQDLVPSIFQ